MKIHRTVLAASVLATTLVTLPAMGLAAVDPYPTGCVSCHALDKAKGTDERLSLVLKEWTAGKIEPGLLAKSKASAPAGLVLKGKHPAVEDSLDDIPGACLDCHDAGSKKAPPFAQLLHLVHLVGGVNNAYVTTFKSDCMHCHKLNTQTGEWKMPSGPEK
jgi:formate-dependent nitrite reductase cytochrome c552 subunit